MIKTKQKNNNINKKQMSQEKELKIKKFTIFYKNKYFETTDTINITLIHMVEIGLIEIIFDNEKCEAWIPVGDGTNKKIKIPEISGL